MLRILAVTCAVAFECQDESCALSAFQDAAAEDWEFVRNCITHISLHSKARNVN